MRGVAVRASGEEGTAPASLRGVSVGAGERGDGGDGEEEGVWEGDLVHEQRGMACLFASELRCLHRKCGKRPR